MPHKEIDLAKQLEGGVVVVDTSSLLMAGIGLLSSLKNCEIVIPAIVVRELEDKRSHATIGFLARQWLRLLEDLRLEFNNQLATGVTVSDYPDLTISVQPNHSNQDVLPKHLQNGSHDSTILAVAKRLSDEGKKIRLLSNDLPMRLHSTLDLQIPAYKFSATQIIGAKPFDGRYTIELTEDEYSDLEMNSSRGEIFKEGVPFKYKNDFLERLPEDHSNTAFINIEIPNGIKVGEVILRNGNFEPVTRKMKANGITGRTTEQDVAISYLRKSVDELPIVSIGGSAGTGKTLITMAVALDEWKHHRYRSIIVLRSLHELGEGQEMGFLPGTVEDKMSAWAGAVYDALDVIAETKKPTRKNNTENTGVTNAQEEEAKKLKSIVNVSPITYLRGRSLANSFIVLEEAQNFSRSEILNILSRAGEGSKVVMTFDAAQVDNKFLQAGKDADIWSVVDSLKNEHLFAHITLKKTERSEVAELASRILEA